MIEIAIILMPVVFVLLVLLAIAGVFRR